MWLACRKNPPLKTLSWLLPFEVDGDIARFRGSCSFFTLIFRSHLVPLVVRLNRRIEARRRETIGHDGRIGSARGATPSGGALIHLWISPYLDFYARFIGGGVDGRERGLGLKVYHGSTMTNNWMCEQCAPYSK